MHYRNRTAKRRLQVTAKKKLQRRRHCCFFMHKGPLKLICCLLMASLLPLTAQAAAKKQLSTPDHVKLHGYIDNYGNLRLSHSPLTTLPNALKIKGALDITASKISV
ncbi:MAG: hypothetical protein ACRC9R_11605, partial [Enterovibrio sp.]